MDTQSYRDLLAYCLYVRNTADLMECVFFDSADKRIYRFDPAIIGVCFSKGKGEGYSEYLKSNSKLATFHYNPYAERGPFSKKGRLSYFNIYLPPKWRRESYFEGIPVIPESSIPPLIDKFINHFTMNSEDSKSFLLDFLANSLKERNGTYLCILSKIQGTGKGVLGEICRGVFGASNMRKVRGDALNSRFNASFAQQQFIMFDEFDFKDKTALDRAKDLVNSEIEIERKGKDTIEIENMLNVYMATNRLEGLKEAGRRFSIPLTADIPLKTVFSNEEIRALQYDEEMIGAFARYLWYRDVTRDMQLPFISERTEEVKEANLSDWERTAIEELFSACPKEAFVPLTSIQDFVKKRAPHIRSIVGRKAILELTKKYPDQLQFSRPTNEKGVREYGVKIMLEFPDFQPDQFCPTCRTVSNFGLCEHDKSLKYRG